MQFFDHILYQQSHTVSSITYCIISHTVSSIRYCIISHILYHQSDTVSSNTYCIISQIVYHQSHTVSSIRYCIINQILYHHSDTVSSISETIFVQGHIRELTKKLPFSFHLELEIFMEASHEDNQGLPYAEEFAYLPCTHARFPRRWVVALLLGQGEKQEIYGTPDL